MPILSRLLAQYLPVTLALVIGLALLAQPRVASSALPPEFEDILVASISAPMDIAWTPDGRILVPTKGGQLRVVQDGILLPTPAIDLAGISCTNGERGFGGIAVHPNFAVNNFIYAYYTFNKSGDCAELSTSEAEGPGPVNRFSRFVLPASNIIDPASEVVLFDTAPLYKNHHNGGDIEFGADGFIYVTVGDGGSQRFDWPQDPGRLLGKIVRLTESGGIPPGNPFTGPDSARCAVDGVPPAGSPAGTKCQEVFNLGLRNPFRFAFDPNASDTRFFVNDVGQNTWEEISEGPIAGADYGWPVREGPCVQDSTTDCTPVAGLTDPVHWYQHGPEGAAVTGAAFVPDGLWPVEYDGAYLYADYVFGKIYQLTPGASGCRSCSPPTSDFVQTEFADAQQVVGMAFGPYGATQALYYITRGSVDGIRRIAFTGTSNRSPVAVATADPAFGALPLVVQFDGTASSDPDGDPRTYEWDFEGDSVIDSLLATPSHTYSLEGTYFATLTVSDGRGGSDTTTIRIDAGNLPPVPVIVAPIDGTTFAVGDVFTLNGAAMDPEDGALADAALTWEVRLHHHDHFGPFLDPTAGNNIVLQPAPGPEDIDSATESHLEILLTATDSRGLSATVSQIIMPRTVELTFDTVPTGLNLILDGTTIVTPATIVSWENHQLAASAPDQDGGPGIRFSWLSWSDGGAQSHSITVPVSPASYSATFVEGPALELTFVVSREGGTSTYNAVSSTSSYSGSLKFVVESAADEANADGGGVIIFEAGDFDLGGDWFELRNLLNITFEGQGIDITILRNNASDSTDTEPFDFSWSDSITIRDMTISAGGPHRSTSDVIDFDGGDNNLVERVKIISSRGDGIIFDGKDAGQTADGNIVRDCIITGVPDDGIEFLGSSNNLVENCLIYDVGSEGILINRSSSSADQPNKPSSDNIISGNTVINAGDHGIRVNSSHRNLITGNIIMNSSDDNSGRDGINITASSGLTCDDNVIQFNTSTDDQAVKTQEYGLNIQRSSCNRTVVRDNILTGNLVGDINDNGTDTIYGTADAEPPTAPTSLAATSVTAAEVGLMWGAATDNIGVVAYDVYRDGSIVAIVNGSTTTYLDLTVAPSTAYQYLVRARDGGGNTSGPSNTLDVTTLAPPPMVVLTPTDDTYIKKNRPDRNHGSDAEVKVDANSLKQGLLRFDVTGVAPASVLAATLRMYVTNGSSTGGEVLVTTDTSWSEDTVTWNTAPAGDGGSLGQLGDVTAGTWVEMDVTALVSGDGPVSIRIESTNPNGAGYASKENSNGFAPQLIVLLNEAADETPPSAPTSLAATEVLASAVTLGWGASTDDVGVTAYDVYRDAVLLASVGGSTTTYLDASVAPETPYQYSVLARDAADNTSGLSNLLDVTTPADTTPPSQPGNLATTEVLPTSVALGWDASTDDVGVTSYDVYRDGGLLASVGGSTTSYADTTAVAETFYQYLVIAGDGAGNFSLPSNTIDVTTPATPDTTPPSAPGSLIATDVSHTAVTLDWAAAFDDVGVTGYDVYRGGALLASVGGSTTSYVDGTVAPETFYQYFVRARDAAANESDPSNTLDVTTPVAPDVTPPSAPGSLSATDVQPASVTLGWTASTDDTGVTAYDVYRDGGLLASVGGSTTSYVDNTVAPETFYQYFVRARDAADNGSDPSNTLDVTTPAVPDVTPPSAPSDLTATDVQLTAVTLGWLASTDDVGVTAYDVYRGGSLLASVGGSTTSYVDATVAPDTFYQYFVRARDAADNGSDPSNTLDVTTPADTTPPSAPANLLATEVLPTVVTLGWDAAADDIGVTGYHVYRNGLLLASVDGATTGYVDGSVAAETAYAYWVIARDAAGNASAASNTVDVTTPPQPSTLVFTPTDDATVRENRPDRLLGASSMLEVDGDSVKQVLIRFDISGIGGASISSVTLRLFATNGSSSGGDVYRMTNPEWSESDVTWNTAPPGDGGLLGIFGRVEIGFWWELDVTPLVSGDGVVSIRITSINPNGADYISREGAAGFAPQLVIELN